MGKDDTRAVLEGTEPAAGSIQLLYVDDPESVDRVPAALEEASDRIDVTAETDPLAGLDYIEAVDCVVSGYRLPGMTGLELFETVRERGSTIPFILYVERGSEMTAERAMAADISGYVPKGADQETVLTYRIEAEVRRHRKQRGVQQTLRALEASRDGIAIFDSDGQCQYVNDTYASFYGYRSEELVGAGWEQLYPEAERQRYRDSIIPTLRTEGNWVGDCECLHREGFQFRCTHSISQLEEGGHVCVIHNGSLAASES